MDSTRSHHLLWVPLFGYLIWFLGGFAWFDGLTSIANDSVNYLVMARHYSPWVPESPAVALAWQYEDFPPLFPLLLAITGAAHSLYWSHVLVGMIGLLAMIPMYYLAYRRFHSGVIAIFSTALIALTPGYLLALQGILSESLYLLLSLICIMLWDRRGPGFFWIFLVCIFIAALMLTRTIGFSLWVALVVILVIDSAKKKSITHETATLLLLPLVIYFLVTGLWGPDTKSHYIGVLAQTIIGEQSLISFLIDNFGGLVDAWRSYWLIYWHDDLWAQNYIVLVLGIMSLLSTVIVVYRNPKDLIGWYVMAYLGVLLVWPHPGQMVRLIMPVVPLMVLMLIQLIMSIDINVWWSAYKRKIAGTVLLVLLVMVLPAQAFMNKRIIYANDNKMWPLADYFRIVSIDEAWHDLRVQQQMLDDFSSLGKYLKPADTLIYYVPAYPAVLSNSRSLKLDVDSNVDYMRSQIIDSAASHLMLTYYHPRKKRKQVNALIDQYFEDITRKVYCSEAAGEKISCLYRIDRG
jgi:hypothetical protein